MTLSEIVVRVASALDARRVPYMLTGAVASSAYGLGRGTKDLDVVLELQRDVLAELVHRMGPEFRLEPQIRSESVTGSSYYRMLIDGGGVFIRLFVRGDDDFAREQFHRRITIQLDGKRVFIPTAEDIVVDRLRSWKLASRPKEHADAVEIVAMMAHELDWDYIRRWCTVHGTLDEAERLRAAAPP